MRKLAILLFCALPAFGAALNGTVGWTVTNGTNGNANNGGGFDAGVSSPGTNLSLSAPVSFSDLVCSGTTCTSVTLAFGLATPGNILQISGTRYECLSQLAGTCTFNASIGTGTFSGVAYGALDTWAHAESAITTAGQTIWMQITGTPYVITATVVGANVAEHSTVGFLTAWNDQSGLGWASRAWPVTNCNTAGQNIFNCTSGTSCTLDGLELQASGGTFNGFAVGSTGTSCGQIVKNSKLYGAGTTNTVGIDIFGGCNNLYVDNTEFYDWYDHIFVGNVSPQFVTVTNSYLHGATHYFLGDDGNWGGDSFYLNLVNNVIDSNPYCVHITSTTSNPQTIFMWHSDCTNSTNDGINNQTAHHSNENINVFSDNIIWGNGGYGINQPGCFTGPPLGAYGEPATNNGVGNNTTANYLCVTSINDQPLSSTSPFVSTSNFALNGTSGAGALLKAAAFPGGTAAATGYADIGAYQSQSSSGGGAVAYVQ